eukprot:TRINITY_DN12213_c0_g1_i1.p1 TRINITY_DN12213_c0_g1~~TRINITY_DN12213_c0_g1_i1.p1  ORF type:complete len:159 (-),score=31.55 TRINITY_DN12213_c0_g1_i1:175-651(-)
MHSRGVAHRDFKPENILIGEGNHMKISDFGCAANLGPEAPPHATAKGFVGTSEYVPPELISHGVSGRAGDVWALGCVLYQMLCGTPPFRGGSDHLTFVRITAGVVEYPDHMPTAARDLIQAILVPDPVTRPSFTQIKEHEFFSDINWNTLNDAPLPVL